MIFRAVYFYKYQSYKSNILLVETPLGMVLGKAKISVLK